MHFIHHFLCSQINQVGVGWWHKLGCGRVGVPPFCFHLSERKRWKDVQYSDGFFDTLLVTHTHTLSLSHTHTHTHTTHSGFGIRIFTFFYIFPSKTFFHFLLKFSPGRIFQFHLKFEKPLT